MKPNSTEWENTSVLRKVQKHPNFCALESTYIHMKHHPELLSLIIAESRHIVKKCVCGIWKYLCVLKHLINKANREKRNRVKSTRTAGKTVYFFLSLQYYLIQ